MKKTLALLAISFIVPDVYALPTLEDAKTAKVAPSKIESTQKQENSQLSATPKKTHEKKFVSIGNWAETTGDRIIVRDKPSLEKWETYGYLSKGERVLVLEEGSEKAIIDG